MTGDVVAVPAFWDAGAPAAGGLDGLQVAGLEHLPCCPVQAQAQPVLDVHPCIAPCPIPDEPTCSRLPVLCDQRYTWTHLFAAVQPATGRSFALVLPEVSTVAMQAFLDRFGKAQAADEHAVMVMDQAGWHTAHALAVPDNVTLVRLPPYSPELNPVERSWRDLKRHHLAHHTFKDAAHLTCAIHAAVKQLNTERQTPHPCDKLNKAA